MHTVARSSIETELIWLQNILEEIGLFHGQLPTLWCDNIKTTYLSINPISHSRIKHAAIHNFHFVEQELFVANFKYASSLAKIN